MRQRNGSAEDIGGAGHGQRASPRGWLCVGVDTLFLTMPVSWKGTLVQYSGRLHRLHPGKSEVRIYDYVDREVPMLAPMFEKRLRGHRAMGNLCEDCSALDHPIGSRARVAEPSARVEPATY